MAHEQAADTSNDSQHIRVVQRYIYITWLYLIIFIPIFVLFVKKPWVTVILGLTVAMLVWAQWAFQRKLDSEQITLALAIMAGLTVGAIITAGGVQDTGYLLLFPYVPFIVFLRKRASAQRWLIGMLLYAVGLLVLGQTGAISPPYDQTTLALAILMYLLASLLTLSYVDEKAIADKYQLANTKELLHINHKLSTAARTQEQIVAKDEAILKSIGEGVVVYDARGRVETCNQVAENLLGFSEKQLVSGEYTDLVRATNDNGVIIDPKDRPLTRALTEKQAIATTLNYRRSDGTTFPAQISVAPIIMNGVMTGAVEVFRDVYLEKQVDRSKTEFVSLASHQLRTPLSTISWYAEMLLAGDAGKVNKEQARYIEEIYQSNRRMTDLVGSLLNVSRLELGTFSVEPEPTDLVKLAQATVKDLEPKIFARKINFRENYASDLPSINVDPKLMRMVIENLASNAIKYTPETGSVTLSLEHSGNETHLTVEDTGYGIPKQQQGRIFSKLFRADNVKAQDTEGTGLGLYLVKSIVDYSGGKISFQSKENKGTTFSISLPDSGMKHKQGTKGLD